MKRYAIATGAGTLLCAASVFVFYGLESARATCATLVREPANIGILKKDVIHYRETGAWDESIACSVEKAKDVLRRYISKPGEKPAVVIDIDDTALSNWEYIITSDFGYNHDRAKDWENSAKDPAIEPVKELYDLALEKNFAIFFITGRRETQRVATEFNLQRAGFDRWEKVFFKPADWVGSSAVQHKTKWRALIEKMGYTLVLNIGDQYSDLEGEPQAQYNFKIANPAYFIP